MLKQIGLLLIAPLMGFIVFAYLGYLLDWILKVIRQGYYGELIFIVSLILFVPGLFILCLGGN